MSIRSELNNTKYYLRESRKAILGRGGEISEKAGLKDIPEAVWSIPADASLAFREDSDVAYEKVVPVGAEEYALVKSLGGMSYKAIGNNNLCSADGRYECSGMRTEIPLGDYGHLEDGWYYISIDVSELKGYYGFKMTYTNGIFESSEVLSPQTSLGFNFNIDTNDGNCSLIIMGETLYSAPDEVASDLSGFVKNIMLCKADDADKTYKPYQPPMLLSTKPTSLESRGANLFDESAITGASNNSLVQINAYGVVENGYLKAKYSAYASLVHWLPFSMKLTKGTYTISADMYIGNVCPSLSIVIGLGVKQKSSITARTNLYAYDTWERKSVTITLAEDNIYYFVASGMGDSTNYTDLDARFKNIQIRRGETATEFHPFSAEPIDTLEIPEAVQSLDGWGLGVDAEYNNHIEWRNGRVFYVQEVVETILKDTMTWIPYTVSQDGLYCYNTTISNKAIGFQTSICSHFNNVNKAWSLGRLGDYSDHDTLPRCYFKTDKPTVEEWKAYLAENEIKLVYALATPIETDITHLFTDTSPFLKMQGGGGVIANNERKQAVPSTLKYTIKVG